MGRAPCCDKSSVKRGPWSPEEDAKLKDYIDRHGTGGNWIALPQKADLKRCGKSCRLRWLNYLRPNIKHGEFSDDEDRIIYNLFASIGSRWSIIAAQLPGRTDNDIKNYWNTKLKKKLMGMPKNSIPRNPSISSSCSSQMPYFTSAIRPFEAISPTFTPVISTNPSLYLSFIQNEYNYNENVKSNILIFGAEASCSSSDGSSINENLSLHKCLPNGTTIHDEETKYLMSNEGYIGKGESGCFGEINPLDYSIEEIKQLVSSSNSFFVDEIKSEENIYFY